jgi:hypothetical protein
MIRGYFTNGATELYVSHQKGCENEENPCSKQEFLGCASCKKIVMDTGVVCGISDGLTEEELSVEEWGHMVYLLGDEGMDNEDELCEKLKSLKTDKDNHLRST